MISDFELQTDWLRAHCQKIHYFGLGFIQLKVDFHHRLHFYAPGLDAIVADDDVHNHRYDFTSMILCGRFRQSLFKVTAEDTHIMEPETCEETGEVPDVAPKSCGIRLLSTHEFWNGARYSLQHDEFHNVEGFDCITLLERSDYKKSYADVIRRKDSQKVCPFGKKMAEDELWQIVDDMIRRSSE